MSRGGTPFFVTLRGSKTDGGGRRRSRLRGQWANSSKACIGKLKTQVRACRKVFFAAVRAAGARDAGGADDGGLGAAVN